MGDGKGYLIPENATPDDMDCILVFYPNDPLYLRALVGSLAYLGTWTAWERSPDHRGLLAAKAWKDANDCTFDSMSCITELVTVLQEIRDAIANQQLTVNVDNSDMVTAIVGVQTAIENQSINLDAGELLPALTGIQTAIENQELTCNCGAGSSEEDMPIVINNCCCCGGGGNSGNPDTTLPPEIPPDYNPPIPMPDPTEPEPENDPMSIHKCAYAHYMVVKWRNTCVAVGDGSITATNLIEKLQQTFNDTQAIINWSVSDWSDLWVYLGLYLAGVFGYSQQIANEIDSKLEAIKCAILQETSADQKKAQVATLIDVMGLPQTVKLFMKQVFNLLPLGSMYGGYIETGAVVPSWAYASGCPGCIDLGGDDFPVLPASYQWVMGVDMNVSNKGTNTTTSKTGNTVYISVPASGDRWYQPTIPSLGASDVLGVLVVVDSPLDTLPKNNNFPSGGLSVEAGLKYVFVNDGAPLIQWPDGAEVIEVSGSNTTLCRWEMNLGGAGESVHAYWYLVRVV